MFNSGVIDILTTAKEAYERTGTIKVEMSLQQFHSKFYNWKKTKLAAREDARNGGAGPPAGKWLISYSIFKYHDLTVLADALAGNGIFQGLFNNQHVGGLNVPPAAAARNADNERLLLNETDGVTLPFSPPSIVTVLRNELGQRIIEVLIWLPSGVRLEELSVYVADDMKHLKLQMFMDPLIIDGWNLHRDLIQDAHRLSEAERSSHVRVHHWNSMIDELRTGEGLLPRFAAEIDLPEEVSSKRFLRQIGKASMTTGTKFLLVDLLIEDSKVPAKEPKLSFDFINGNDQPYRRQKN